MSNTIANEITSTKNNKNYIHNVTSEQKEYNSTQKNETEAEFSESKTEIAVKYQKNSLNNMDNFVAISTVYQDTVIDIGNKLFQNASIRRSNWFKKQQTLFRNFLRRGIRKPQNVPQQKYLNQQRKFKTWTQFAWLNWTWPDEDDEDYEVLDYNPETRNDFVRLVMAIVGMMFLVTAIIVITIYNTPSAYDTFKKPSVFLYIFSIGGLLIVYFIMLCCKFGRSAPWSYVILVLTVLFASFVAAIVTCRFNTEIVALGLLCSSTIVAACVGLACTDFDFTSFWLYLIVVSMGIAVVAMSVTFGMMVTRFYIKPLHIFIVVLSVTLHSLALIMELQMILGGKSVQIGEEDHAMAAFMLYTSIIDIFIKSLQLCGLSHS